MDQNNDNRFNNVQHGSYEDYLVSPGGKNMKNHNEKRKAQDISKNDLKDSCQD